MVFLISRRDESMMSLLLHIISGIFVHLTTIQKKLIKEYDIFLCKLSCVVMSHF